MKKAGYKFAFPFLAEEDNKFCLHFAMIIYPAVAVLATAAAATTTTAAAAATTTTAAAATTTTAAAANAVVGIYLLLLTLYRAKKEPVHFLAAAADGLLFGKCRIAAAATMIGI